MTTFDRVLPEMLATCESPQFQAEFERCCVVRDVRGRARLVVRPVLGRNATPIATLEAELTARLGAYFVPPIFSTEGSSEETRRLARNLIDHAKGWPAPWPREFGTVVGATTMIDAGGKWLGIERTIGKEAWLASTPPHKPWPLVRGKTPPIVTFHSFKGGVGRTTLVASHAVRLASVPNALRVAVIDLDLEAPGVGSLFGVESDRGVIDVLVDHVATNKMDLDGASVRADLPPPLEASVTVFPAGRIDDRYVQKLARLDFSSVEPDGDNPVGAALSAMLRAMRERFDVILLDSRAGFHDLAGMSLHGLAHVDVLVFRGTEQGLIGLEQTVRALRRMPTRNRSPLGHRHRSPADG